MINKHMTELRWQAINNPYYRCILETGDMLQIALMSLRPGEETGMDVHPDSEEMLVNVTGNAKIVLDGEVADFCEHDWMLIKPGAEHNIINTGKSPLKMIVMFTPPHFLPGTVHKEKPAEKSGASQIPDLP